jgi:hypothetical protein
MDHTPLTGIKQGSIKLKNKFDVRTPAVQHCHIAETLFQTDAHPRAGHRKRGMNQEAGKEGIGASSPQVGPYNHIA